MSGRRAGHCSGGLYNQSLAMTRRRFTAILAAPFAVACNSEELVFRDVKAQTKQFMDWEAAIQLTAGQEAVKKTALEAIPAACRSDNTAYTCCCPCNLSRSIWGLSHHLIAERNWTSSQVQSKVEEWIAYVGPDGFEGQACYTGGCNRPFHKDGCGGMNPDQVQF